MLFALIELSSFYKSTRFFRSNKDLQDDTALSQHLVIATLDTLFRAGIINVECIGKGTGRKTNIITVHFERFKEYEKYSFDEARTSPDLFIKTVQFKGTGCRPSYIKDEVEVSCYNNPQEYSQALSQEQSQIVSQEVSQKVPTILDTLDTLKTQYTINQIDIIDKEETLIEKSHSIDFYLELFINYHNNFNYHLLMNEQDAFYRKYEYSVDKLKENILNNTGHSLSTETILNYLLNYLQETGRFH